jgi:hypothetical protein
LQIVPLISARTVRSRARSKVGLPRVFEEHHAQGL